MTMVRIPAMRIGEYRMDVTQVPAPRGGLSGLQIAIREPQGDALVKALDLVHERPMHLFVVGRSLEYFAHLHPQASKDGTFDVRAQIPAGEYMVVADFLPTGGWPQTLQRFVVTPGVKGSSPASRLRATSEFTSNGVRVVLTTDPIDLIAGKNGHLRFAFGDAASGKPVSDFEPFLGAPAHLFLISDDLTEATHAHPDETALRGAELVFDVTLPKPGLYKMWIQFQRRGVVTTASFVVSAG
jgi:hypothetical protein